MRPKLSFKFIANACGIFIGKDGTQILCDPWLIDGVFDGSWCHFPKLKTTFSDVKNIDALYISHLHPDHFDERFFEFDKLIPIIVLDHGPNFLIKKLESLGYRNLIKIRDNETIIYREFKLTMFAPFAKHNFHEATVGNLIDSALLISCEGISALNANDNTPTAESASLIRSKYGPISLAMLNYNAAGPYPSCFDNLTEDQKVDENNRILVRNFNHLKDLINHMTPMYILPFAGAYVLGGSLHVKNKYLGTTTWDECANWLKMNIDQSTKIILLREDDTFDIESGLADKPYIPIDTVEMEKYIETTLSIMQYPYQNENLPDEENLIRDIQVASDAMIFRMKKFNLSSSFNVILDIYSKKYQIYPTYIPHPTLTNHMSTLECKLDERLLRYILDKKSHWNNAEIGAHISFNREPNIYEPDLHTGLQFFHL